MELGGDETLVELAVVHDLTRACLLRLIVCICALPDHKCLLCLRLLHLLLSVIAIIAHIMLHFFFFFLFLLLVAHLGKYLLFAAG